MLNFFRYLIFRKLIFSLLLLLWFWFNFFASLFRFWPSLRLFLWARTMFSLLFSSAKYWILCPQRRLLHGRSMPGFRVLPFINCLCISIRMLLHCWYTFFTFYVCHKITVKCFGILHSILFRLFRLSLVFIGLKVCNTVDCLVNLDVDPSICFHTSLMAFRDNVTVVVSKLYAANRTNDMCYTRLGLLNYLRIFFFFR